ncbi:MAG: helix-turn-helix transcriptional regulator [Phycisphaerales bacterium]|nr:helix-turn-helix transcriptional regulator [Phycisphaerales bacterium]
MATQTFGDWFRKLRLQLGLSAAAVSRKAGLSLSYVSVIEAGRAIPKPSTIRKLADALGLTESERGELSRLASVDRPAAKSVGAPGTEIWKHLPNELYTIDHTILDAVPTEQMFPDCIRVFAALLGCAALRRGMFTIDRRQAVFSILSASFDGPDGTSWNAIRRRMIITWRRVLFSDLDTTRELVSTLVLWRAQRNSADEPTEFCAEFADRDLQRYFQAHFYEIESAIYAYDLFTAGWLLSSSEASRWFSGQAANSDDDNRWLIRGETDDIPEVYFARHLLADAAATSDRRVLSRLRTLRCMYALPVRARRWLPPRVEFQDLLLAPNKPRPAD